MPGTERTRFCASCDLDVHDTSRFTRDEVEALFRKRREGDRLCIRLHVRESDGAVLLADGAVLPSRALTRKRGMATAALTMAAAAAGASSLAACASPPHPAAPSVELEIAAPPAAQQIGAGSGAVASASPVAATPAPVAPPPLAQSAPSSEPPMMLEPPSVPAPFPVTTPPVTAASKPTAKKIIAPRTAPHPLPPKNSSKRVLIIDGDAW